MKCVNMPKMNKKKEKNICENHLTIDDCEIIAKTKKTDLS